MAANVPISETGIAMSGMIAARQVWRKDQDDEHDKRDRSKESFELRE